jgi:hypothetical protein
VTNPGGEPGSATAVPAPPFGTDGRAVLVGAALRLGATPVWLLIRHPLGDDSDVRRYVSNAYAETPLSVLTLMRSRGTYESGSTHAERAIRARALPAAVWPYFALAMVTRLSGCAWKNNHVRRVVSGALEKAYLPFRPPYQP